MKPIKVRIEKRAITDETIDKAFRFSYRLVWRIGGKTQRPIYCGRGEAGAKASIRMQKVQELELMTGSLQADPSGIPLTRLIEIYMNDVGRELSENAKRLKRFSFAKFLEYSGDISLDDIDAMLLNRARYGKKTINRARKWIIDWETHLQPTRNLKDLKGAPKKEYAVATRNMMLRDIKALFSYATEQGYLIASPADKVSQRTPVKTTRALTDREIDLLVNGEIKPSKYFHGALSRTGAFGDIVPRAFYFHVRSWLRPRELMAMDWRFVQTAKNPETGESFLAYTVNIDGFVDPSLRKGAGRKIALDDDMLRAMGPRQEAGPVWGDLDEFKYRNALKLRAKKLGLLWQNVNGKLQKVSYKPHLARHTGVTRYLEQGGHIRTAQEIGGWRSQASMKEYEHTQGDPRGTLRGVEFAVAAPKPRKVSLKVVNA